MKDWGRNNKNYILLFICISVIWCIFNYAYSISFENYYQNEAFKYYKAALFFNQNGFMPSVRYYFYGIITWLISFQLSFQFSPKWIILTQLILNFISIQIFGLACAKRFGLGVSFLIILFLIGNYDWTVWNFYLYSESTFFSFTLLWLSSLIALSYSKYYKIHFLLMMLCIISRPFGIGFILFYGLFILQNISSISLKIKIGVFAIASSLVFILANIIAINIGHFEIYKSAIQGCIICGVPTQWGLKNIIIQNSNPIITWYNMVLENPTIFINLFFMRLNSFFALSIPYFSFSHNIQNIILKSIVYLLIGYRLASKKYNLDTFEKSTMGFLLIYLFFIGTQCNEWSMRFFSAIWPFLILLSFNKLRKIIN